MGTIFIFAFFTDSFSSSASVNNAAPASTACPDGADEVATNADCYTATSNAGKAGTTNDGGETIRK